MTLGTVIFVYSSDLIEIIPRSKIAGSTDRNIFKAFDTLPSCLPERLCHFTPAVHSSQRGVICTSKLSLQAKASAEAEQSPCYLSLHKSPYKARWATLTVQMSVLCADGEARGVSLFRYYFIIN